MIKILELYFSVLFFSFNANTFNNFDSQLTAGEIREIIEVDSSSGCIEYCFREIKEHLLIFFKCFYFQYIYFYFSLVILKKKKKTERENE